MDTFLEIIGILAIGVVVVLLSIYVYIRIKLGKYVNVDTSKDITPLQIHLNEEFNPDWIQKKYAQKAEQELISLGFTPGKTYYVVELDGFRLKAFFNHPYTAVLYTHPIAGLWVDMGAETVNGIEYTVTNAPMGGEMDTHPKARKYFLKDFTITQLFNKLKEVLGTQKVKEITQDSFRDYFENVYKREMEWKSKNAGVSFEEFKRVAQNDTVNYTDEEIKEAYHEHKRKELLKWHDIAIEEYISKESISESDCYNYYDNFFIVPSKADPIGFIRYLANVFYINDEQAKKFEEKYGDNSNIDIKTLFKEINESFSKELRAVKKGETNYPLEIEIYEMTKSKY